MLKKYTPEEFWKVYDKLPEELQSALFSEETAKNNLDICERNEIENSRDFVELIGYVLSGLLHPDDFEKSLIEDLGLDQKKAKKIALEAERFLFYPVKNSLSQLYNAEIAPLAKKPVESSSKEEKSVPQKSTSSRKDAYRETKDVYREAVEEE